MAPRRIVPLALAVLLGVSGPSWAQQRDDLARVRARFPAPAMQRLETIIEGAEGDGVPRVLLVEKAVEGAAKGHEPDVVIGAVSTLAGELRATVRLLGHDTPPAGLEKATDAIRHGVQPGVVRELAARNPDDFPILLQAIEDLLHAGVELDAAQGMVLDASSRGMESQDVLTLPATVRRLVREGRSPVEAATSIRQSLRQGRPTIPPAPPGATLRDEIGIGASRARIPPPSPGRAPPF